MSKITVRIVASLAALAGATLGRMPVRAQDDWIGPSPMDYAQQSNSYLSAHVGGLITQGIVERNAAKAGKKFTPSVHYPSRKEQNKFPLHTTPTGKMNVGSDIAVASTMYPPSPDATNAAINRATGNIARSNPQAAQSVKVQLQKYGVDSIYAGLIRGTGLAANDLADALTAYTVLNYMIANDVLATPPSSQIKAVRNQFATRLAQNPAFQSAQSRAEAGEELKTNFVILHAGWQSARKDGKVAPYREGIAAGFQKTAGIDPRKLRLTEAGLAE